MKDTMSKRNIAKFHKLLKAKAPQKDIVKILKVKPATLKRFMPEKVAEFKKKAAKIEAEVKVEKAKTKKTGEAIAAAAAAAVSGE